MVARKSKSAVRLAAVGVILVVGAALAHAGAADDGYTEKVTVKVPCAVDNTEAMALRDRCLAPPAGIFVVPNVMKGRFPGLSRVKFELPPDRVRELFHGKYFPGPGESGLTPGDPDVAVGPNHVVAVINGQIAFYTKSSGKQTFVVSPASFFASLGTFGLIFDPRVFYDQYSGRFFLNYPAFDSTSHTFFLTAVSDDSDPNGNWTMWGVSSSAVNGTMTDYWSDYPGFGASPDVLLWTANMYGSSFYAKVRIAPKQQFLSGSSTITYTDIYNFTNLAGDLAYSLQPGRHCGNCAMPVFVDVSNYDTVNVFGVKDPLTNPTLVKSAVSVATWTDPDNAVQKGTATAVSCVDDRIYDVNVRDNRILVTHNVGGGSGLRSQWFEIDASSLPASISLTQQGFIGDTSCAWFADPVINQYRTIGIGYTQSSANEYLSLYYTGRLATDTLGSLRTPTLKLAGNVGYDGESNPCRWGDYCGGAIDPVDNFTFWAIGMVPWNSGYWTTEIYSYTIGTPALLTGTVALENWVGDPTKLGATIEFRTPGATSMLSSYPITLDSAGKYKVPAVAVGAFDVAIKFSHWLREVHANVTTALGSNVIDIAQLNGDANQDNAVDASDLGLVLAAFKATDPAMDLDGSGKVGFADLSIVLANLGLTGVP